MQIQIDKADQLDDLLEFLRAGGCIALRRDHKSVEALVPGAASPLSERRELGAFLRSWEAQAA
jgi:hypothetical protein